MFEVVLFMSTNTNPFVSHLSLQRPTQLHRSEFFSCVILIFTCISLQLAHILAEIAPNASLRPRKDGGIHLFYFSYNILPLPKPHYNPKGPLDVGQYCVYRRGGL